MAAGKNITWKKKGKIYNLPFNIYAVRENIKWGKRKGTEISRKEK